MLLSNGYKECVQCLAHNNCKLMTGRKAVMIHLVCYVLHLQVIRTQTSLRKCVYLKALGYLLPSEEKLNHLIKHKGQERHPPGHSH